MVTLDELRDLFVEAFDSTHAFLTLANEEENDARTAADWALAAKNTASVMHSLVMVQKVVRDAERHR